MAKSLKGKNAFVGGSSKGIGWETAKMFAENGANVILVGRNKESLNYCLNLLPTDDYQKHSFLEMDYSDIVSVKEKIKTIEVPIHILINNTGGPAGGLILEEEPEKFASVFSQHLLVNQLLVKAFINDMKKERFGRIINITSISLKQPIEGLGVSNTVRWAVAAWAKTLSREVAKYGITVNNILPGYTLTGRLKEVIKLKSISSGSSEEEVRKHFLNQMPSGRFVEPEEVANAILFLCSDFSGSINGINLPIDGGFSVTL